MTTPSTWTAVAVAWILSAAASARVTIPNIYGYTTDSSGAAVPAASVTATNELTAATALTQTNSSGDFKFTILPFGRYRLVVEARGFKAQQHAGVELAAGQSLRLPVTLAAGALTESLSPSAEPPLVEASASQQRQSFRILQVRELPEARRDWTAFMVPWQGRAANASPSSGNPSLNGLPTAGLTLTIDGTDAGGHGEFPSFGLYTNWNVVKGINVDDAQ